MKFNFDDYKNGKYAMNCRTKEEDNNFRIVTSETVFKRYPDSYWLEWDWYKEAFSGFDIWEHHKEDTCYGLNNGFYSDKNCFIENDYKILEWSDFMYKGLTKTDLRSGDVILRRNGGSEIFIGAANTLLCESGGYNSSEDINEDLTFANNDARYDIIAVRRPVKLGDCHFEAFKHRCGELIYDRDCDDL